MTTAVLDSNREREISVTAVCHFKQELLTLPISVTTIGIFYYQIQLDALKQHLLFYLIAMFRTGGGSPTRSKELW